MNKILSWSLLAGASAITLLSCTDDEPKYIIVDKVEPVEMTWALADSLWNEYASAPFVEADETIPTDPEADFYKDFYENWIDPTEDETRDIVITYKEDTVKITYEDDGRKTKTLVKCTARGAHVTIHNDSLDYMLAEPAVGRARMNYILRGTSANGSLRIYSNRKFRITIDGVNLTNPNGAAINIQKSYDKKRAFICLANDTENTLCDGEVYSDTIAGEDDKACLFSEGKMVFCTISDKGKVGDGTGKLTVTGRYNHAIASDSRIYIHRGVELVVANAVKDGIHSDALVMGGGLVKVFAAKDAVQCEDSTKCGLQLLGGRLLSCGKRALTTPSFNYVGGDFVQVGNLTSQPSEGQSNWEKVEQKGYSILHSN